MLRVVIDTNVFFSSFFGGKPGEVVALWKSGQITLCLTQPIVDEYVEVLQRGGLSGKPELEELLALFARRFNSLFTVKTPQLHLVKEDPDDDKFIECAVALNAKYIVSGDKALLAVKKYMAIGILTPKEFLEIVVK